MDQPTKPSDTFKEDIYCVSCKEIIVSDVNLHTCPDPPENCIICNMSFDTKVELNDHRKCICTICWVHFTSIRFLTHHMLTHNLFTAFVCKACQRHFLNVHNEDPDKLCKACQEGRYESLNFCVNIWQGSVNVYRCNKCGKLTERTYMIRHLWTHEEVKPFACGICQATYSSVYQYRKHMRCHLDWLSHVFS